MTRPGRVSKSANSLGRFIRVGSQQIVEAFMTDRLEEPLAGRWISVLSSGVQTPKAPTYMYGPGSPFNALKQRHVSSTRTGPPTLEITLN
jgi:hypothetical protein